MLTNSKAFRPGNVDLPADQSHAVNPASLTLPDVLTELDLLAPLPDPSFLLGNSLDIGRGQTMTIDWGTQSLITDTIEAGRTENAGLFDDDLDLDDMDSLLEPEKGRFIPQDDLWNDHAAEDSKILADDLDLDLGLDDDEPLPRHGSLDEDDVNMTDYPAFAGSETGAEITGFQTGGRVRDSVSPLSELDVNEERNLELSFRKNKDLSLYEPQEESTLIEPPRLKRRKVIQMDSTLELRSAQIREQQTDRSKILKPASFLPRDPVLLALLAMQKNGGFVSNILGDGRSFGWAPELRDVLSVEIAKRTGNLKRKRDSGVADLFSDDEQVNLDFPKDETMMSGAGGFGTTMHDDDGFHEQLDDEVRPNFEDEAMSPAADFDETTMPLLHPADAGPISLGTQHAVHMLREHFGPEGEDSPGKRSKSSVLLQDLIPEARTSRRDATKMFFEILVLATKDAVKVEQKTDTIGGPIRLRAKRGLWGSWAEEQTAATQATQATPAEAGAVEA
jgi:cohesin complex subunit SCC1